MGRLSIIADHFQREIGFDARAHIESAGVEQRPAAVIALDAPYVDGDQAFQFEIRLFAAKMAQEHVFGRDRNVGLKLETPMSVLALTGPKRLRRRRYVPLKRFQRRRVPRPVQSNIHGETPVAIPALGADARIPTMIEAAL